MNSMGATGNARRSGRVCKFGACAAIVAGALLAGGLPVAAQAATPSFEIVSPKAGSTVSDPVKLDVAVTGVAIGTPSSGADHLHVSVDGGEAQPVYKNQVFSLKLAPGKHTIAVELAYPTHQAALPPKSVTFTVR